MSEVSAHEISKKVGDDSAITDDLNGLGGWLILVGLGVVLSPMVLIFGLVKTYSGVFASGAWSLLTTPSSSLYNPLWKPIVLGELLANIAMIIASIMMITLFFSKKRLFPKLFVGFVLFGLTFILVDAAAVSLLRPDQPMLDAATIGRFARSSVQAMIWVPYMFVSKRVRSTFVN